MVREKISMTIDPLLKERAIKRCNETGATLSGLVALLLRNHLNEYEEAKK
jgi:antitoxin component of RelBE/YafQ-DinJ toxin-antitoxin module|tara:strand:+ start:22129 stop:22278 length:150 start_codon:yes stop_codon:yes gene_type:complete